MMRLSAVFSILVLCSVVDVYAARVKLDDVFGLSQDIFKSLVNTNPLIRRVASLLKDVLTGDDDSDEDSSEGEDHDGDWRNGNGLNVDMGDGNGRNRNVVNGKGENGHGTDGNGGKVNAENGPSEKKKGRHGNGEIGKETHGNGGKENGGIDNVGNGETPNKVNGGNGRGGEEGNGNAGNGTGSNGINRNANGRNGNTGKGGNETGERGSGGNGKGENGGSRKKRAVVDGNGKSGGNGRNGGNDRGRDRNGNSRNDNRENAVDENRNGSGGNGNSRSEKNANRGNRNGEIKKGESGNGENRNVENRNGENKNSENGNGENRNNVNRNIENRRNRERNGEREGGRGGDREGVETEGGEEKEGESEESEELELGLSRGNMTYLIDLLTRASKDRCVGTVANGRRAVGCVANHGCCQYRLAIDALCAGEAVCCYTRDLCEEAPVDPPTAPGPSSTRSPSEDRCLGTVSNSRPAIGCVKRPGCCQYGLYVSALCDGGAVCCYSRDACRGWVDYRGYTVSDAGVREHLQKIADLFGTRVWVTSGDRNWSGDSLHNVGRAADFWVDGGMSGIELFNKIRQSGVVPDRNYEFIFHGPHTCTGGVHLHIGHYGYNRASCWKLEGTTAARRCNYECV